MDTDTRTNYFVVPRAYGDSARVLSAHPTLAAARRAASEWSAGLVVRKGHMAKGDRWLRVYEEFHPVVPWPR